MSDEVKCRECGSKMGKSMSYTSGSSRFVEWKCTECNFKETKCLGLK